MNPITIVGGGLAGLSLGIALRRRDIPVVLYEAGRFPRHKVCGEFISGVGSETLDQLHIAHLFEDAGRLRKTAWFYRGRLRRREQIPNPAIAISRYRLDHRLAQEFSRLDGRLILQTRVSHPKEESGWVWTCGRNRARTEWIGLKAHCFNFPLHSDLELHLGTYAYAGASGVENGRVNLCGLFRIRRELSVRKDEILIGYLRACGLPSLAERLQASQIDPDSICATAAVDFKNSYLRKDRLALGDQYSAIPPFTGNGMSMAFESAAMATDPLVDFARKGYGWNQTIQKVNLRIHNRFRMRLLASRMVHPFLYHPLPQLVLVFLSKVRILPFQTLFRLLR